jgi:hypothetical protein
MFCCSGEILNQEISFKDNFTHTGLDRSVLNWGHREAVRT